MLVLSTPNNIPHLHLIGKYTAVLSIFTGREVLTLFAGLRGLKKKKSEEIVTRLLGWTGTGVYYIHITWVLINRNTGNLQCFDIKTVLNYSGITILCLLSLVSVVCNTVIVCCKNQSRSSPVFTFYFSPSNGVVAIKLQKGMDRWLGFRNGLQFGTRFPSGRHILPSVATI